MPVPGLYKWEKPLGQEQHVPVGQANWDKLCLSQWDKHSLSQLGLGKVKRDLSLSHRTSHIPTLEAFPCPGTSSIPTMELVPVPLVPTCPTKWVYKAVEVCVCVCSKIYVCSKKSFRAASLRFRDCLLKVLQMTFR